MKNEVAFYICISLLGVFISSVSQILLKKSAQQQHKSYLYEYLNLKVISAYVIFFVSTFLAIYAYKVVPLSMGPILEATSYIYITFFAIVIFKEKINLRKIISLALIVSGICISCLQF